MSALWTAVDLVKATGGVASGDWCAWRVEIDSRKVQAGDIYVAIRGARFDGHDFVADAFSRGAIAAIVERKLDIAGNQLIVTDCFKALDGLAKYNRTRSKARIIGVTGSVGKTTTKEMLRLALSTHGKTYATTGNYNNHIGTPLNLANLPLDAEFAVFEMGMNHAGEIAHLTKMVRPHIALISCVEAVHLEYFSSVEEIAKAKAEIFEGLEYNGTAIINADQNYFHDIKFPKITFGANDKADCRLLSYKTDASGALVSAEIFGEKIDYKIAAMGKHVAVISLSVLAVCHALGLDMQKSADALAEFAEVEGRGRVEIIKFTGADILLINDSYNASPASMRAAFAKANEVWLAHGSKGRKVAMLGDMLELGKKSATLHSGLAEKLITQGFDKVYTAGSLMKNLYDAIPEKMRGGHAASADELLEIIKLHVDDVVLIKGSHGSKIYQVADSLLAKGEKIKNAV
jgi:UDP-N-acetylmuramoyl-tripeptide--D-alanyl-D-alanine ligase